MYLEYIFLLQSSKGSTLQIIWLLLSFASLQSLKKVNSFKKFLSGIHMRSFKFQEEMLSLFMLGCRGPLFSTIIWSTTNLKTGKRISRANAAFYSVLHKLKYLRKKVKQDLTKKKSKKIKEMPKSIVRYLLVRKNHSVWLLVCYLQL